MSGLHASSVVQLRSQLSDRDLSIVSTVADFRFVSGGQIRALYFTPNHASDQSAERSCRRILARLTDHGVLVRLSRRIGGVRAGSTSHIYCLGPAGHRLLADGRDRQGRSEPSQTFLDHSLAVADVFAAVVAASHLDRLQLIRYESEPNCWRHIPTYGGSERLRPDLYLVLASGELEWHWWLEVDRGTEHQPAIVRKCRQYLAYLQTGQGQEQQGVFPRVAWLTTSERRAASLQATIDGLGGSVPLFQVGLLADPLATLLPEGESS